MFQATDKAVEMLKQYLSDKNLQSALRVMMAGVG